MFAEEEAALLLDAARAPAELSVLVERRASGLPLEQVLGWAELCGVRTAVEPGVFVPRRRSELLVREAAALVRPGHVVVDLCCGSGGVGLALTERLEGFELHAADIDPAAVRCARRNVAAARVYEGDLYAALPARLRGRLDVLVANAPYVPSDEVDLMPREARDHEPRGALDGGADGLYVVRRVIAGAPEWLAPGGRLLVETGGDQAAKAVDAMTRAGMAPRVVHCDELEATVVVGVMPTGVSAHYSRW